MRILIIWLNVLFLLISICSCHQGLIFYITTTYLWTLRYLIIQYISSLVGWAWVITLLLFYLCFRGWWWHFLILQIGVDTFFLIFWIDLHNDCIISDDLIIFHNLSTFFKAFFYFFCHSQCSILDFLFFFYFLISFLIDYPIFPNECIPFSFLPYFHVLIFYYHVQD
jgi:hypothetical protein